MDKKVQIVTEELREMIQPYLGRREYGNLCIVGKSNELPNWIEDDRITWFLNYEKIFSSSSGIGADFLLKEKIFEYMGHPNNEEIRTKNPEKVLNYFHQVLDYIQPQRRENLMANAKSQNKKGVSLEKAVAEMQEFAQGAKKFGPTEEELKLYEKFCNEVYSTK